MPVPARAAGSLLRRLAGDRRANFAVMTALTAPVALLLTAFAVDEGSLFTERREAQSLADLADILGPREAAVARELTKLYEEVRRGTLPDLAAHYAEAGPPRGEVVLVIGPPGEEATPGEADVDALLREALTRLSVRDAAADVAARTGQHKRTVYARALELQREEKTK